MMSDVGNWACQRREEESAWKKMRSNEANVGDRERRTMACCQLWPLRITIATYSAGMYYSKRTQAASRRL